MVGDHGNCVVVMMMVCLIHLSDARSPFMAQFPRTNGHVTQNGVDPGQPLFLSPYIERGDLKTARNLSRVTGLNTTVESYSGLITVDKRYNSNMFFWMFPAEVQPEHAPLLLWLQGGPGGSSLFGLFVENGPLAVDENTNLYRRKFSWTKAYNMLYIDNPVQTGFSFTDNKAGMATNETQVGDNLYSAVVQIMELFPELKNVDFYLTGESYAGKYIPAFAHRIHTAPDKKITLKGAAIGDGFSDPPVMIHAYADYMFETGLLDRNQAAYFKKQTDVIGGLISQKKYQEAYKMMNAAYSNFSQASGLYDLYNYLRTESFDSLFMGDQPGVRTFYTNCTGTTNYYNYLKTKEPKEYNYYNLLLARPEVRKAIHVGNLTYNSGAEVETYLINDVMQSVKPWLAELMDNYKVMIYSGQLDVIVGLPLTEAMLLTVPWSGLDQYKNATRGIWRVSPYDPEVAGYAKMVNNFFQIMVRGGGHILPFDQPERSYDMIHRFVSGRAFV